MVVYLLATFVVVDGFFFLPRETEDKKVASKHNQWMLCYFFDTITALEFLFIFFIFSTSLLLPFLFSSTHPVAMLIC